MIKNQPASPDTTVMKARTSRRVRHRRYKVGAIALVAAGLAWSAIPGNTGAAQAAGIPGRAAENPNSSPAATPGAATGPRGDGQRFRHLAASALATRYKISESEALARVDAEPRQMRTARTLATTLGSRQVGAWLDPASGALTVDVRDRNSALVAQRSGARARIVGARFDALDKAMATFDASAMPKGSSWFIDRPLAKVVLTLPAGVGFTVPRALADDVVIERTGSPVTTLAAPAAPAAPAVAAATRGKSFLYGGLKIVPGTAGVTKEGYCTSGFLMREKTPPPRAVTPRLYMLTAGHCGLGGVDWFRDSYRFGSMVESMIGAGDYGLISLNRPEMWDARPWVFARGLAENVAGQASINFTGTAVCFRGASTGDNCSVLRAFNASFTDSRTGTTIRGMDVTGLCAAGGDSGGPVFVNGDNKELYGWGIISGGVVGADCSRATTYVQPLWRIPRYQLVTN